MSAMNPMGSLPVVVGGEDSSQLNTTAVHCGHNLHMEN